jgi:hypothetical protein
MRIDIRGIGDDLKLQAHVRGQMGEALSRRRLTPVSGRVLFVDDNGPKGGIDIRCTLTVRLPFQPLLRTEHTGGTPRRAFDGAFAALQRQLERGLEDARASRRRPRKYYTAKRLLAEGGGPDEPRTTRATRA